jgi:hypothetical protein
MSLPVRRALFLALIMVSALPASTVLTCGFSGGVLSGAGCYSFATFSFKETIDWQAAFGDANGIHAYVQSRDGGGPWLAPATAGGLSFHLGTNTAADDIRIITAASVPEPSAWILLLTCVGLCFAGMRKRKVLARSL